MQNFIYGTKNVLGLALAVAFVVVASGLSANVVQAKGSTAVYSNYSYPSSSSSDSSNSSSNTSSGGSTAVYSNYSYPSTNTSNDGGNYSVGCCNETTTSSKGSTAIYSNYTYPATTYSTPTYTTTYTYTPPTYNPPTYTPPAQPTCAVVVNKTSIYAGESVTVSWSSSNASSGSISNIGSYLPTSGSRQITLGNTTTFSGSFWGNGGTATCSATVVVTPKLAPTCVITGPDTVTPGQNLTISWSSTNATRGDIQNLGSNLPASGSHNFVLGHTTTFTGTFYSEHGQTATCSKTVTVTSYCPAGHTGTYPNCYPPQHNNPSCSITINNYNNGSYFQPNQAVTISWSSANASWGTINQGLGNVNLSGTRTVYPTETRTYTGTFYGYNGQSVTCSATVYVNGYVPPVNPGTPFVTLSAVPHTGLELGPVGTVLYWAFIAFWCALAAYLIVVKRVQNQVYDSLMTTLFGSKKVAHAGAAHSVPTSHTAHAAAHEDKTDDFILSQINRTR